MDILKKPVITEKMTRIGEKQPRYAFIVDHKANKVQIKSAVEKAYSVNVESVNTLRMPGKSLTRMTKSGVSTGRKGKLKKAIITLKKGETIDFYSSI